MRSSAAHSVNASGLPFAPFYDLLDAFSQDVTKSRYTNFAEVMDYCRRSADPVGRLMLHLYGRIDDQNLVCSNAICSALQLINFWQDVAIDWQKARVYIPQEDLRRFGVSEAQIAEQRADAKWRALMEFECARARAMLVDGAPLGHALPGRLGIEIRATVKGGIAIADKIVACGGDVFRNRPVLGTRDWIGIVSSAILRTSP